MFPDRKTTINSCYVLTLRGESVERVILTKLIYIISSPSILTLSHLLSQHPGGEEVLLEHAGTEATYAFEDVGHSLDARDLLSQYYIGDLHEDDCTQKAAVSLVGE